MSVLTVIVPAYNENMALPLLLERLHGALKKAKILYEVIVVDDHSVDGTYKKALSLQKKYPLTVLLKKGTRGKAQSILEGVAHAKSDYIVMIDADLQYPPEAIPEMYAHAREHGHGVVVARRKVYEESTLRRVGSRAIAFFCGKLLHGFTVDIQSGLKIFRRQIMPYINPEDISPWSLDLPLLHTAKELGYTIGETEIDFVKREHGTSKLDLFKPTMQIMGTAVRLKFRRIDAEQTNPTKRGSMLGAGVKYHGKQFVTHSTLPHAQSALHVITPSQRSFLFILLGIFLIMLGINALFAFQVVVAILSFIYFVDVIFNFFLILKSLHSPPEIAPSDKEIALLKDSDLPVYSILCPLYKEAHVIPQFVTAISAMDWPKSKLEVMLLLEEDDTESVEAVKHMKLPSFVRVVVVPDSQPKTKPKACNYGLNLAKGEYVVIYDAEDKPDPKQLKVAYLAFQTVGPNVKCLQAKLNYYNPSQNWLTRLFTAEYSLWFDVILTGLQSIETTIPLGGTSNHFRKTDLLEFEGWDPFNVTEDCDLGVRLFKRGAKTAIIDSTTLEEANSNFKNWIRQRSRWIKGYMQTYLLHMRDPMDFAKGQGIHAILFQLTVGGKIAFILINPILWVLTIAYFVLYRFVGPTIESLYPTGVFYMAVTSLIFGNFMFIYYYMIGAAKREHWGLMKWIYLIPLYWLMVSIAGAMALYQLIVKPHYWEKTIHGLHLKKQEIQKETKKGFRILLLSSLALSLLERLPRPQSGVPFAWVPPVKLPGFWSHVKRLKLATILEKLKSPTYRGGMFLVVATLLANVVNMLTNFYTGQELTLSQFATINTYVSLLYIANIPAGAFSSMLNYHIAFMRGKNRVAELPGLMRKIRRTVTVIGIVLVACWVVATPFLDRFFQTVDIFALLAFSIVWLVTLLFAVERGYLRGSLFFGSAGVVVLADPITRLLLTVFFSETKPSYVYLSIPLSLLCTWATASFLSHRSEEEEKTTQRTTALPWQFFTLSLISGLSTIAYFTLDTIMVSAYLPANDAGKYGLLGLIGKMIFFAGGLVLTFITPLISYFEGKGSETSKHFDVIRIATAVVAFGSHILLGIVLPVIAPIFFGEKINSIRFLLPLYGLGIATFTLSQSYVSYYLAKKVYAFPIVAFILSLFQLVGLAIFHTNLTIVVIVMMISGVANLIVLQLMHANFNKISVILQNVNDFLDLFSMLPRFRKRDANAGRLRVLIFNWRDTKHHWAGGAEIYIQKVASELIQRGNEVTIFCGSDGRSPRNDTVDGVRVIRRGGFYTVYIWAVIYYVLKLRGNFDVILDSENGVPFLSPLFAKIPTVLLIHHVHQNVFQAHLQFPFRQIAMVIESKIMPFIYQSSSIVTVSESSKNDVKKLGNWEKEPVVVNPGISLTNEKISIHKTSYPTVCYVGRLKSYKNIDVAIRAFATVVKKNPKAVFSIAGTGESDTYLQKLVSQLGLDDSVKFLGKISEIEKKSLLTKSWLMIQPSMIEGWGITVIEANTCGTPVVASNVEGLRDSIRNGKTGLLVKPKNTTAFAEAIEKILREKAFRTDLSRASTVWAKQFSWAKAADQLESIFIETINADDADRTSVPQSVEATVSLRGNYD